MPRMRLNLPGTGIPWTKVPNALLDRLLPELKDTELRIVLLLLRETAGWNREGRPVRLTYQTLMSRTGRRSEAVASALASLCARGVVHVLDKPRVRFPKPRASESGMQHTKTE